MSKSFSFFTLLILKKCVVSTLERIIALSRLEKTHRITQSNHLFALHQWFSLNHVPQHNIQMFFEHHQARWLHHLSRQPIPVPDHPFREVIFPNVQPEPSLAQLEAMRRLRGDFINAYKYVIVPILLTPAKLFSMTTRDRTRDNEHKLEHRKFHTNTRKNLLWGWQRTGTGCP